LESENVKIQKSNNFQLELYTGNGYMLMIELERRGM